jgi:peptidoglycan/xylan/chitin deacetylase (PgdA/CDA1 family)
MFRRIARMLPLVTLGVGSWVGLGMPSARALSTLRIPFPVHDTHESSDAGVARIDPPEHPSVDPTLLPDPNPWPALNPQDSVSRAWLLSEGPLPAARSGRRVVTLSFDDGPFPETTPVVLRILARHHVHATFFWIGRYLDGDSDRAIATRAVAKQVRDAGHLIGTHTHDHERLAGATHAEIAAQIDRGMASVERAIGVRPSVFRPPFGQLDSYGEGIARARGLTLVLWNIETEDLHHTDSDAMAKNLEEQIDFSGGGIVLLHDIRFTTAEALDKLLTWVDHHRYDPKRPDVVGYDVVDFAEFTQATAASPQPFASRAALEDARAAAWRKHHPESRVPAVSVTESEPLTM